MSRVVLILAGVVLLFESACGGSRIPPRPLPTHIADAEELVNQYYRRVNAEDLTGVMALLVAEPVLSEPFGQSGAITVHRGYASVASFFEYGFRTREDQLVTEYVRPSATGVDIGWSLHGTEGAEMSGTTHMTIQNGQIARIDIQRRD